MNIELLQYLQTRTDLQLIIRQNNLRISILQARSIDCIFEYELKDIDNLVSQLDIKSYKICHNVEINENIINLLEKIKKYAVYVEDKMDSVRLNSLLEKYPNIKTVESYNLSVIRYVELDFKVMEIFSKYSELYADVFCGDLWGFALEMPRFIIRGRDKYKKVSFSISVDDISVLQTLNYESFNIADYGESTLGRLLCICAFYHDGEVKVDENKQLCEKCKGIYGEIIQKYDSLFELVHKVKTKKRMLYLFSDELKGKNLSLIDEIEYPNAICAGTDFEKFKEYIDLVVKLGFKGVLGYYSGIVLDLKKFDNSQIKFVNRCDE